MEICKGCRFDDSFIQCFLFLTMKQEWQWFSYTQWCKKKRGWKRKTENSWEHDFGSISHFSALFAVIQTHFGSAIQVNFIDLYFPSACHLKRERHDTIFYPNYAYMYNIYSIWNSANFGIQCLVIIISLQIYGFILF